MWIQTFAEILVYIVTTYGYLGIFLVMIITSATIMFPIPGFLTIIFASPFLNPYLVALLAGLGAALGELTGYVLGWGGSKIVENKINLETAQNFYKRYGLWSIFFFAATPLPFDIIGILCGALKVNWRSFFLLTFAGKMTLFLILAQTGKLTVDAVTKLLLGELSSARASGTIVLLIVVLASVLLPLIYWQIKVKEENSKKTNTLDK